MLAGQLAAAHYTALRLLARSLDHAAHAADFQSQWQREQNVIAGDMTTGGSPSVGGQSQNGGTMPCAEQSRPPGPHHAVLPRRARTRRAKAQPCAASGAVACTGDISQEPLEATSSP
jgi:hypothetical protein